MRLEPAAGAEADGSEGTAYLSGELPLWQSFDIFSAEGFYRINHSKRKASMLPDIL